MFCRQCGTQLSEPPTPCPRCGWNPATLTQPSPQAAGPYAASPYASGEDIGQNAGLRMLLPVGRSWLAIVAGYLGLVSVLFFPAPFALAFGILAIRDIKKHPDRHGMGRAIFGVVMGGLFSLFLLIYGVVLAVGLATGKIH